MASAARDKGPAYPPMSLSKFNANLDDLRPLVRGHGEQLLMSHDLAYKSSLTTGGSYGYHHLPGQPRTRAEVGS